MKLSGNRIDYEALQKDWHFLSGKTDYATEITTEVWINPSGRKQTLYRRYGVAKAARYESFSQ